MSKTDTEVAITIDEAKFEEFLGRFFNDLGAVMHAATVWIGDRVGLYKAMADCSWSTAEDLADRTATDHRYVREWLAAQAASGYAEYDPASGRFRLSAEQALALSSEYKPILWFSAIWWDAPSSLGPVMMAWGTPQQSSCREVVGVDEPVGDPLEDSELAVLALEPAIGDAIAAMESKDLGQPVSEGLEDRAELRDLGLGPRADEGFDPSRRASASSEAS